MKAAVYEKGSPEGLQLREVAKPAPKDNEVLVKIAAASVNALDYRSIRMGIIPKSKIFGADIAGTVEAAGSGVKTLKAGDRVFGDILKWGSGGFAEYVAVAEEALCPMPEGLGFEQAACLSVAGITALQALHKRKIKAGDKVLILGAGGGVGNYAVQLGKHMGAQVIASCGPNNAALVKRLGADRVVDYTREDILEEPAKFDMILAVNGKYPIYKMKRLLKPEGTLVIVGGALRMIYKGLALGLLTGGKKLCVVVGKPNRKDLAELAALAVQGVIAPVISRRYPLEKASDALRYLAEGHATGKVVIKVSAE